jgi:DNA-binding NarL/FixJ family response regulator
MEFHQFQTFIAPILQQRPNWHVVAVATEPSDAVRLARHLHPDLILLDLDLPRMNGINAARQIRMVSPESKIVFLSRESSASVLRELLEFGVLGYVKKDYASSELIAAMEAVLQHRQFIGSGGASHELTGAGESRTERHIKEVLTEMASPSREKPISPPSHEIQFYSEDRVLLDRLSGFVEAALRAGHSAAVCATRPWRDHLVYALQGRDFDVDDLIRRRNYMAFDAVKTLSAFTTGESLDRPKFLQVLGGVITSAADAARGIRPRVALYQECSSLLWAKGRDETAIQLERLVNELVSRYDVDVLCGYSLIYFHGEEDSQVIHRLCAEHSAVNSE